MTDFDRIRDYYQHFDEDNRLKYDASGRLEYEMTLRILAGHLPTSGRILDLGGGTGVYSFVLASQGYEVYLADLSDRLVARAKEKDSAKVLKGCDVVNATDLSMYDDSFFDAVIAFGPFYHLTEAEERNRAIKEISRVLKPEGTVLAAFIPYLSGSIAIVDRLIGDPTQVNAENLEEVFRTGKFVNRAAYGFQEGFYAESHEVEAMFAKHSFSKEAIRSVRGFAYEREEAIESISDHMLKEKVFRLIEATAVRKEIIETCGHAIYIGQKCKA